MRTITETFAAGETKSFAIPGERFELITAPNPITVSLRDANGIELTNGLSQNIVAGSYMQEGKFFQLAITSAIAQTITFVIANGESGTRSVAGTVAVIDSTKSRTLANGAFLGQLGYTANANYPGAQLWNPVDNTKNIIIERIWAASPNVASTIRLQLNATMLANTAGGAPAKLAGGAASSAQLRWDNLAAVLANPSLGLPSAPNVPLEIKLIDPIVLTPGHGATVDLDTATGTINTTWEFFEE